MTTITPPISLKERWKALPLEKVLAAVIIALLCLRLVGLLNLPIFVDEVIHIDWVHQTLAGEMAHDAFTDGKTLSIWLWAPFVALPVDPLLMTRFASVLTNVITVIFIISLGSRLVSKRAGLISALVYILLPYSFFQGRMALVDNFVTTLFALLLWLTERATRGHMSLSNAVALIMATTAVVLSKFTGILSLPTPILGALLLSPAASRKFNTVRAILATLLTTLIILFFVLQRFGIGQYVQKVPGSLTDNISESRKLRPT